MADVPAHSYGSGFYGGQGGTYAELDRSALAPPPILPAVPTDPFTGGPFNYLRGAQRRRQLTKSIRYLAPDPHHCS